MTKRVHVEISGTKVPALLVSRGPKKSRIIFEDHSRGILVPNSATEDIPPIAVPRTPLHDLYYRVGHTPGVNAFDVIKRECGNDPYKLLLKQFRESVKLCRGYSNLEPFYEPGSRSDRHTRRQNYAHLLVRMLKQPENKIVGFDCSYVDRELSCLRTTNAIPAANAMDDPRVCSMDILLRRDETGLPVITEVKAKTDKGPAYALIQLLKYASELVSENQFMRLRQFCPEFEDLDARHPCVEMQAVFEDKDSRKKKEWDWAEDIAGKLMEDQRFCKIVRRIIFRQGMIKPDKDTVQFKDLFEVLPQE